MLIFVVVSYSMQRSRKKNIARGYLPFHRQQDRHTCLKFVYKDFKKINNINIFDIHVIIISNSEEIIYVPEYLFPLMASLVNIYII